MLSDAQTIFEAIGHRSGAADCLKTLSDIQHKLNHNDEPQQILSNAQAVFESIGSRSGAASCLKSLGFISQSQNRVEASVKCFTEAKQILIQLGSHTLTDQEECDISLIALSELSEISYSDSLCLLHSVFIHFHLEAARFPPMLLPAVEANTVALVIDAHLALLNSVNITDLFHSHCMHSNVSYEAE